MKRKRISIIAVNDNAPPKLKQTNKVMSWVVLVGLLIVGIFFAFD
jgi:hypothetical protein